MEHKILMYGGGALALIVAFVVYKKHGLSQIAPVPSAVDSPVSFSSLAPISGGISSGDSGGGGGYLSSAPSADAGSTGGSDLSSMLLAFSALQPKQPDNSALIAALTSLGSRTNPVNTPIVTPVVTPVNTPVVTPINNTPATNTVDVPANNAVSIATSLYSTELGREPDQAGLDYWVNRLNAGESVATVKTDFDKGPEYAASHPLADPIKTAVVNLYKNDLNRRADDGGFYYYVDMIKSGKQTITQVNQEILSSPEYNRLHPTDAGNSGTSPMGGGMTISNP